MSFSRLSYSIERRICRISLSRPEKRNALDDLLVNELTRAFLDASKDSEVKVIVLTGEGKAFCAGADLDYLQKLSTYDFNQNLEDSKNLMRLFHLIYTMRKPVIAKVNGAAIAGGCGLATVCDIVVASEESTFGYYGSVDRFYPRDCVDFFGAADRRGKSTRTCIDRKNSRCEGGACSRHRERNRSARRPRCPGAGDRRIALHQRKRVVDGID